MMGTDYSSPRRFKLWDYHVSLSQLLLRSRRDERVEGGRNIDLLFRGVFYLDIPVVLSGLEIRAPTPEEVVALDAKARIERDPGGYRRYFVIASGNFQYCVGASFLIVDENSLGLMETSLGVAYTVGHMD